MVTLTNDTSHPVVLQGHIIASNCLNSLRKETRVHLSLFKRISLIAQLVKNLSAMQETLVKFLGWEDPLEKG